MMPVCTKIKIASCKLIVALFCIALPIFKSSAQIFPNSTFEAGVTANCSCPTGYTCANDAGRVVDGFHSVYVPGNQGCITTVNYANVLGAFGGTAYVYFYAGGDRVTTPTAVFAAGDIVCICVMYCGPQGSGASGQNTANSNFKFGVDAFQVGPTVLVPVNTVWTQHCFTATLTAGTHSFNILSGGAAQYAIWFDNFTVTNCNTLNNSEINFTGNLENEKVNLLWESKNEFNCSNYTIQKSIDGLNFSELIKINSVGNNLQNSNYYTFNDDGQLSDTIYYNLQQFDLNGILTYSNVIYVLNPKKIQFSVYPNPSNGVFQINTNASLVNGKLEIFNSLGQSVLITELDNSTIIKSKLPSGIYSFTFNNSVGDLVSGKIVIE